jgi:DnaK suppressor protein
MTRTELTRFRRILENRRTDLRSGNGSRESLAIETSADPLDRIQDAGNRDWAMGDLERKSRRLREVQAALQRIDTGAFGICVGCEENISAKRLAAVPWAASCVVCQEIADREQTISCSEIDSPLVIAA